MEKLKFGIGYDSITPEMVNKAIKFFEGTKFYEAYSKTPLMFQNKIVEVLAYETFNYVSQFYCEYKSRLDDPNLTEDLRKITLYCIERWELMYPELNKDVMVE